MLPAAVSDIALSHDGAIATVSAGAEVSFWEVGTPPADCMASLGLLCLVGRRLPLISVT